MAEVAPILSAKGVTVTFGGVDVVANVDLDLRPGEIHALVGENGAGKSSLAKAIAGVYRMREGGIEYGGREAAQPVPVVFKNPREALAAGVALIHQEPSTFPDLDVAENIFAGNLIRRAGMVDHKSCCKKAGELLDALGANIDARTQTSTLSIAQKQLVELAAALAHEARVWIFDETTAPLTPKETDELFGVMQRLKDDGCAVVMVTHHLDEVFKVSDRVTVLRDGEVVARKLTSETNQQEIVSMMVGRDVEKHEHTGVQAGKTVLQTKSLTGDGFRNVEIEVREGEVVGVAGLVGAGRTELARAVFGIAPATSGTILIDGKEQTVTSPRQARSLGIALVPEDRIHDGLLLPQSIAFNTTLASLRQVSTRGFLKDKEVRKTTEESAERLSLVHRDAEQPVEQLSGGNQQKVVLSKWLMTNPRLLILDEPTRGVDVGAKQEVHKIIRDLAASGLAVLMVSSDLPEVLSVSDRILVMRGGEVVAELSPDDATEESVMVHATGGSPVA